MDSSIIVAILSLAGTAIGGFAANRKNSALVVYRLKQLEDKVNKHNNLVERMYKVEEKINEHELRFKVTDHRIEEIKE